MSNLQAIDEFSTFDAKMMARALKLAEKGLFSTTPNPHVGCVIVDSNLNIIGEGFHKKAGDAHAEVVALDQAKSKAKGATAYVTLEPCAHYGKTPPCALALINAGIAKVVLACTDPNPHVSGKGIAMLQSAGVVVAVGLLEASALRLNKTFFHNMLYNRPFVSVKLAASLDGKTALENGESKWITCPQARTDVQSYRARVCAILTGADTIIADNPSLNVRSDELSDAQKEQFSWRQQQPLRVIIDSQNRLNSSAYKIFNDGNPVVVYNAVHNSALSNGNNNVCTQKQLKTIQKDGRKYIDIFAVLEDLSHKGINHLWVEAGARLTGALFDIAVVDELILYQAPKILGDSAKGLTNATAKNLLRDAIKGKVVAATVVGSDTKTVIEF